MSRLKQHFRRLERDERGMTLIELVIGASLMLVVVGLAGDALFSIGKSSTNAELHTFSLAQNRVGVERLTNLIRQATYPPDMTSDNKSSRPIVTHIDPNGITFTSRAAGDSTIRRYTVAISNNKLQIGRAACTGQVAATDPCTWNATPTMRTLVTNVQTSSTGPCANRGADSHPFRFYATSSPTASLAEVQLAADPANNPNSLPTSIDSGSPGNDATLGQVDTVQINLYTQETGAGISNTCENLSARVNLRNLSFS